jgi:hypothetical protein
VDRDSPTIAQSAADVSDLIVREIPSCVPIGGPHAGSQCRGELGRRTDNAAIVSAAGLRMADVTARVFVQETGSFKATAERLALHRNTGRNGRPPSASIVGIGRSPAP